MDDSNCTSSPWNRTDGQAPSILAMKIISLLGATISILGVGGNGLILYFLLCSVKWDRFSVFLLHLALADFALLACVVVRFMEWAFCYFHGIWFPHPYMYPLILVFYTAGLCLVVAIGMGRALSVFFPIWFRLYSPKYLSTVVCVLIWLLAISLSGLFTAFCYHDSTTDEFCVPFIRVGCLFIILLLSATLLCIVMMLLKVKCSSRVHSPHKLYIAVALSAVSLLSLALPALRRFQHAKLLILYDYELLLLLASVHSSANPFIYYFAGSMGRQRHQPHLREVFQTAIGEELDPSSGCPAHSTCESHESVEVTRPRGQGP